jgi:hypothetical protein
MTPKQPPLDPASAARRADWIAAVRALHERRSGEPSRYNSKVNWDGGVCPLTGRKYTPVWPRLVQKARAAGADPRELVAALFSDWIADTAPTPHHLLQSL